MGWQSCTTYAGHSPAHPHRASLIITQGARQNATRNMQSVKGPQKPLRKRSVREKRDIPVIWSRCCQAVIRSGMLFYIFDLVKSVEVSWPTPWIILDHPRLIFWVSLHTVTWTVFSLVYHTMVLTSNIINCFNLHFNYDHSINSLNIYTFIQSLALCIISLMRIWTNDLTLLCWRGKLKPGFSPPNILT